MWRATADQYQRTIKAWGVTTTGPLSTSPYFIRLSKTGDPNAAISYNVGNGGPTLDQRSIVDAGFLEYVRLGILPASDPVIANSLAVTDGTIQKHTANGPGWLRYNGDGYGDCVVELGQHLHRSRARRGRTATAAPATRGRCSAPSGRSSTWRTGQSGSAASAPRGHQRDELGRGPRARAGVGRGRTSRARRLAPTRRPHPSGS